MTLRSCKSFAIAIPLLFVGLPPHSFAEVDKADPFSAAREHLQKGRYEEALEAFDELAASNADPERTAVGRSRAYEAEGRWKEATETLVAAAKASPRSAAVRARLAEVRFRQGDYAQAEKDAAQALTLDDKHPLARYVQADLFTETGRLKEADEAWRWFVRYYNQAQPEDAETLLLVGRGSSQYARWKSVSSVFTFVVNTLCPDVLKDDPQSWQAWHLSGALLLEKYNRAQAIPELKKALAINPRAKEVLVSLADAALQQNDYDEALDYAGQALKVDASCPAALCIKADVALARGKLSEAREFAVQALAVNPREQRVHARLAACELIEDGLPPEKEFDGLLSNLDALDEVKLEDPSRFSQRVIELAKRNPRPGYFLSLLGDALASRRQYDGAERVFRHAVAVMPQLSGPKNELGMLYMRVGRMEDAQKLLDEAFKSDPYHVRVSNMRKVLKLLDGYETLSTEHFVVRYDSEQDKILAKYMAEYLEEIYPALVKQFGYEPEHRTQFELYNKSKGLSAHQWFSARMVGLPWVQTIGASTGVIVALASPNAVDSPFNWARVVKHEFVHVITLQQTKFNIPHWFTEALAVTSEGYPRPAKWDELLLERVPKGELRSLDELTEGFTRAKSADDWQFAYCQSRLYAQYMIETYGEATIAKMLDAYRRNVSTDKAIPDVFGVDRDDFEKGYREFLDRTVAEIKAGAGETDAEEEDASLADLEKAHLEDKEDAKAAAAYAFALLAAGKRKEARELAEEVVGKNPAEIKAALVLAALEVRAEDYSQASKWLEPALDRAKPDRRVLLLLAKVRQEDGRLAAAAELFELGRKAFPNDLEMMKGLAAVYVKIGATEADKLKELLSVLAQRDPDDAVVRKKLAQMAFDAGEYDKAIEHGRSSLQVNVLDAGTHTLLGKAYAAVQNAEKAAREFEVAWELDEDDADAAVGLAQAQAELGNKAEARKTLDRLLEKQPDHDAAKSLREKLGSP